MSRLPIVAAAVLLLGAPALLGVAQAEPAAQAATIALSAPTQALVDAPATYEIAYDTGASARPLSLSVLRAPASEGPCGPAPWTNAFVSHVELADRVAPVQGVGRLTVLDALASDRTPPGRYRLCAWLHQAFSTALAASAPVELDVRGPGGTLAARFRQSDWGPRGARLTAELRGTAETRQRVVAQVRPSGERCRLTLPLPNDWPLLEPAGKDPRAPDGDLVGPGPFALAVHVPRPLPPGRWRVCAVLASTPSTSAAAATATVATWLAPVVHLRHRPAVVRRGGFLRCERGRWTGVPRRLRFAYAWTRDGRIVPGARRPTLRVRTGGMDAREYTCRVTVTNAAGSGRWESGSLWA